MPRVSQSRQERLYNSTISEITVVTWHRWMACDKFTFNSRNLGKQCSGARTQVLAFPASTTYMKYRSGTQHDIRLYWRLRGDSTSLYLENLFVSHYKTKPNENGNLTLRAAVHAIFFVSMYYRDLKYRVCRSPKCHLTWCVWLEF